MGGRLRLCDEEIVGFEIAVNELRVMHRLDDRHQLQREIHTRILMQLCPRRVHAIPHILQSPSDEGR